MHTCKREHTSFRGLLLCTALITPSSVCGNISRNTHYFAKSQNHQGLKFILNDTSFMKKCSCTIHVIKGILK